MLLATSELLCVVQSAKASLQGVTPMEQPSTTVEVDRSIHDFGDIAEARGRVQHRFLLSNHTEHPVVILSAYTGCGCTVAAYPKRPIAVGERVAIVVTFDPTNRPGYFEKKVTVRLSSQEEPLTLVIRGRVLPRKKSLDEQFPCVIGGGVRAALQYHNFGYIRHGASTQSAIELYNSNAKPVTLRCWVVDSLQLLQLTPLTRLEAHERVSLNFGYNLPRRSEVYGSLHATICFEVDGKVQREHIDTEGIAVDDPLIFDDNCRPIARLSENIVKFGAVNRSSSVEIRRVVLQNEGEVPLTIRKVESRKFRCNIDRATIPPASQVELEICLTPAACDYGAVVERVRIVTNDPEHPVLTVRVTAIVEHN
jgi:hypothetical protein